MSIVINKYPLWNPCRAYDVEAGKGLPPLTATVPTNHIISKGTTFEILGIDTGGFILHDISPTGQGIKYMFNAEVVREGFYHVTAQEAISVIRDKQ
jgi:hypothetical protein